MKRSAGYDRRECRPPPHGQARNMLLHSRIAPFIALAARR